MNKAKVQLQTAAGKEITVYSLKKLEKLTGLSVRRLPYSLRILLENALRHIDSGMTTEADVLNILNWDSQADTQALIPFMPSRIVMQDFAGLPAVLDLVAMREAFKKMGGDPTLINPLVETVLVIDHSLQADYFGDKDAFSKNVALEFERNHERYTLLKWAQQALTNFKVVPPGMGIIHQVNLEYLATVITTKAVKEEWVAYPDSVLGTDSHTTMINSLGVMGWGVGGIEAEAVMLGQPYHMILPKVVGVQLTGQLSPGVTATDLALHLTERLREKGVVEKFVEFYGPGVANLSLPDRATIANMAPEYGATMGFFAVDQETCRYLKHSNRPNVDLIEMVCKELLLYQEDQHETPEYTEGIEFDLGQVDATLAGPKRPHDRVPLRQMKSHFQKALQASIENQGFGLVESNLNQKIKLKNLKAEVGHGAVGIAAITSCTNTSNPYLMIGAGLIAKKAVEKGLAVKPYVKTTLAPGSRVVREYLAASGLLESLEKLHFNIVGYGCTTCVGNSGELVPAIAEALREGKLIASAVLSGNRNFEGRIHPLIKANYLASPMYVIAYAIAGTVDFDFETEALGESEAGEKIYLRDLWPSSKEIQKTIDEVITPKMYKECYQAVFEGTEAWQKLKVPTGQLYNWQQSSSYIHCPPFFENLTDHQKLADIADAQVLALLGDSITTDHISPVGSIPADYPAGHYLQELGIEIKDFNAYGARRGNHEVMMRGTFANVRLRNLLLPGLEGGLTCHHPTGEVLHIYDAAMRYKKTKTPLLIIAGKEYGTGSARDWAAKGTALLGVKAVIAESYERIHRSNLVGMGILPLQFIQNEGRESLGLKGSEFFAIQGVADITPRGVVTAIARSLKGEQKIFAVQVRLDTEIELNCYKSGGILQMALLNIMRQ